ncbi:LOW QUALITY PROTEIN: uncharacterized protein LOC123500328 [Portunus trituberculatus]|uniref:LOW QUALITY PROTEIN: uncharacterized protein LOC123500328 n=1 Tax=Portunus trituberculatus TaxID=210409 RepID=UPI001E1D2094|nr:LOW QUALITY PROTEIN: uncharacterized protein LOC123500328 [Portunus trituberculatus]
MFKMNHSSKIKNDKILRWRLELSGYQYDIRYRPGKDNVLCDTLSRACAISVSSPAPLDEIHASLCHPGVTRLYNFVRSKNLAYSLEDVKRICSQCTICSMLKPRFYKPPPAKLIHSMQPFDRISVDFIGPKPSCSKNKYLLVAVDEYSRAAPPPQPPTERKGTRIAIRPSPFAFPCSDMSALTVILCLKKLFTMFGCPSSIHSDRGPQFMSKEICNFLMENGIVYTHSSPYHPQGNGQCERENGIIWKAVQLALRSQKLPDILRHGSSWESVLDVALHSIRLLLCTATNQTPHERLFSYHRKSCNGYSLPSWLSSPGPTLLRKFVRSFKTDPLVERVELVTATPHYARVRYQDGRESTVSTSDLAPFPRDQSAPQNEQQSPAGIPDALGSPSKDAVYHPPLTEQTPSPVADARDEGKQDSLHRSIRIKKPVDRLTYY